MHKHYAINFIAMETMEKNRDCFTPEERLGSQ